ncbi:MAG: DNA polymerase III subunit gamma/tau [Nitriliruptoraceae bacterium]
MAYVSLYRRYRPRTFEEVVGQEHVTRTLINALEQDRLAHAYLFTGPRGTGKTSTARILAAAINCEQGPTATPCGTCEQCTAITTGRSVDVVELDMASHGGVDDARELRDRALFAPAQARRKVYILDEVHMASTAAFNALLKLIEEPPAHVLFAMATTDPQKVIPTILSRVQRLDLRRVAATAVADHVRSICSAEGYTIEAGAVDAVVRAGDGSVRDTLSVLEQVLAYAGTEVTAVAVEQTLGASPAQRLFEVIDLLAARDLAGLLRLVQSLLDGGHDLRRFTLDLVQHARDLLVLQVAPDDPALVDATEEHRIRLREQTSQLSTARLLRMVDLLAHTVAEQRQGSPRLPLELALSRLAVPAEDADLVELAERVAALESVPTPAAPVVAATEALPAAAEPEPDPEPAPEPVSDPVPELEQDPEPELEPEPEPAQEHEPEPTPDPEPELTPEPEPVVAAETAGEASADDPLALVQANWDAILELIKQTSRRYHAIFEPAVPVALRRNILTLRYAPRYGSFHAVQARGGELSAAAVAAVERSCGFKVRLDIEVEGTPRDRRPQPPSVTPDDARTPVLDDPATSGDEAAEVREAEAAEDGPAERELDTLLVTELDAELLGEHPAPAPES